jgi:hypothetical protein
MSETDDVTVTTDWLRSVLGSKSQAYLGSGFTLEFYEHSPPDITYDNGVGEWSYGHTSASTDLPPCPTRGDVRRLCVALGVTLLPESNP